ncbi:NUDIX domain-containing protein [Streptomyces sp. 549]|uniref:NUDIX domain-containing protein n=1 Tax=Streptomyces sp. 549 TaxID=3049076 RepID=UPI0024C37C9D|nr:NUDIX domain-containing protein [Streptomyces sp. 549]MDK1476501.1 NUDIX domain-containing protein [Streptomyces sp. 549]
MPTPTDRSLSLLVAAVLLHDRATDRVLLLQRGPRAKFAQGRWDLPVGKCEPGEAVTDAAVRELLEETGVRVDPADLRLAHVVHGARGVEAPGGYLTVVFAADRWTGEPHNAEPQKHARVAWVPLDAVPADAVAPTAEAVAGYRAGRQEVLLTGW